MSKPAIENQINTDRTYKFNFIGKGKIFFIVSLIIIITGVVFYFVRGFNFGIDFLGGNLMEVNFKKDVTISEVRKVMEEAGYGNSILQNTASDQFIIRTVPVEESEKNRILDELDTKIGINRPLVQDREVAPGFSKQITKNALIAVAISLAGILIYIWIRFEVRFAITAIIELLHDLLIILSVYIITYREFNITTIAVVLTILGYSVNDAIIIFDRVREELRFNKRERFFDTVNYSINKTFIRSMSTVLTTLFPVIVLLILGNPTLQDFAFGLFVGIISGTYSSIFIGSPLLVLWNNRFPK
ncbi:MAG TPA: protein translocase subunit SecF, partial [Actinobacteria bacterium]|nr:protein translocase subunit SecF [Actinomycetota bacterium]